MHKLTAILSTLALTLTTALAACDTAHVTDSECAVVLHGVQPGVPDVDGQPGPDHLPWASAKLKGDCTPADVAGYRLDLYGTTPGLTYRGAATVDTLDLDAGCVVWTWPEVQADLMSWAVLLTPEAGGDAAAVWSDQIPDFQAPSGLPAYNVGRQGWTLYLPGVGVPTGCAFP